MNNLMTRKIILGLLMTCVLAFGVQGVTEAIVNPNTADEARFTTTDSTVRNVGDSVDIPTITITPDKANSRETVSISKTSGIAFAGAFYQLSGGLTEVDDDLTDTIEGSSFSYTAGGRKRTISGTATGAIPIRFTSKGIQSVTISSTDNDDGADGTEFSGSWSRKYTYYVKGPGTSTTTVALKGLSNGYRSGLFSDTEIEVHSGDSGHYDVTYTTVSSTDAAGQIENTEGALVTLSDLNDHNTSSAFDVWLTMNATRQVNVKVAESDIITTGTYILGTPRLTVGYPDNPDGLEVDDSPPTARGSKAVAGGLMKCFPMPLVRG